MRLFSFFKKDIHSSSKDNEQKRKAIIDGNELPMQNSLEALSSKESPVFPFESICNYDVTYYDPKPLDNGFLDLGYAGNCLIRVSADGSIRTDKDQFMANKTNVFTVGEDPRNSTHPFFALLSLEDRNIKIFFSTHEGLSEFLDCLRFLKHNAAE